MRPSRVPSALRQIASKIDASRKPSRSAVSADVKAILAAMENARREPEDGMGLNDKPFDERAFEYDLTALLREARRGGWTEEMVVEYVQGIWPDEVEGYWDSADPEIAKKWKGSGY